MSSVTDATTCLLTHGVNIWQVPGLWFFGKSKLMGKWFRSVEEEWFDSSLDIACALCTLLCRPHGPPLRGLISHKSQEHFDRCSRAAPLSVGPKDPRGNHAGKLTLLCAEAAERISLMPSLSSLPCLHLGLSVSRSLPLSVSLISRDVSSYLPAPFFPWFLQYRNTSTQVEPEQDLFIPPPPPLTETQEGL